MEEYVGKVWHNAISKFSDHRFPEAKVNLSEVSDRLSLQFHALGGHPSIQIRPTQRTLWAAKPSLLSRFANVGDKTELAWRDKESIRLPSEIAVFPSQEMNRKLYLWLLVLLSCTDLSILEDEYDWFSFNQKITRLAFDKYPGIKSLYQELIRIHLQYREQQAYVRKNFFTEELLLRNALAQPGEIIGKIAEPTMLPPVPVWLHPVIIQSTKARLKAKQPEHKKTDKKGVKKLKEKHRRQGEVVDDPDGRSGLMAFRLESYFSWSEFINVDRTADDSDEESAQQAADDMDIISVSESSDTMSSRLNFDLDLPSKEYDDQVLLDGILLPEWDFNKQQLVEDYCSLKLMLPRGTVPSALPKELIQQTKKLRAQFEQLKPEKHWLKNQTDGSELDIDNIIRYQTDVKRGQVSNTPGFYKALKHELRDLSCLLLADLSLSTDAWVNNEARVIDIIRESLFLFSEALEASGDNYAISGFSSVKRSQVRYYPIKEFAAKLTDTVRGHIAALEPGYYTRMGAAIRQATQQLIEQPTGQRLLLLLTDGKPNDIDRYEGRYGIEDTRKAIQQAREKGLLTFCVTIDEDANQYLPYIFGRENYILVKNAKELPKKLLKLYSSLTH